MLTVFLNARLARLKSDVISCTVRLLDSCVVIPDYAAFNCNSLHETSHTLQLDTRHGVHVFAHVCTCVGTCDVKVLTQSLTDVTCGL